MATYSAQRAADRPPPVTGKRPSIADDDGREREIKRRASKACTSCRARKVRCDVTSNDSKCTNCRLDSLDCIVVASRRGQTTGRRSSTQGGKPATPKSGNRARESLQSLDQNASATPQSTGSPTITRDVPVSVTFDEDPDKAGRDETSVSNEIIEDGIDPAINVIPSAIHATPGGAEPAQAAPSPERVALPKFIARLSGRIPRDDLDFLVQKGAMMIPEPVLHEDLLRGYLLGVHPFMPMLDFPAFRDIVLGEREDHQVSLLLFQAVMFAGLHALKLDTIHRLGFTSAKQAREVFFHRVRLLYEFDIERDSAAVLQSLILMSSWYGKWDERKHTWHWTGLAYDVARNMGLHREPTERFGSDKVRHFRRRLWWSLYIRDRLIALGTRRPMRIRDDEFDVLPLTLEDFDIDDPAESTSSQVLSLAQEETKTIALMCIQLAELCKCIGHVVSSQYTVLNTHPDVPYTMMVVSRRNADNTEELQECDRQLKDWQRKLSKKVRTSKSIKILDDPQTCAGVHWTILNMTHLTVINVLHRAQALQQAPETAEAQSVQQSSKAKVKETARSLTKTLQTMLRHDQVRFLSPVGVTALVAASLSHMLDVSSNDEDIRDASAFRLSQNLQVLQAMKEAYASADAAISFLATVTRRAGLLVPSQISAKSSTGDRQHQSTRPGEETASFKALPGSEHQSNSLGPMSSWHLGPPSGLAQPRNSAFGTTSNTSDVRSSNEVLGASNNGLPLNMGDGYLAKDPMLSTVHYPDPTFDAAFGGMSNSASHGAFFDWGSDADPGMDLDAMAFNHDFYSDTFQII